MSEQEKPKRVPLSQTPRTRLFNLHLRTMSPARASFPGQSRPLLSDDATGDLDETVAAKWKWADEVCMATGKYPDQKVLRFLGTIEMETAH